MKFDLSHFVSMRSQIVLLCITFLIVLSIVAVPFWGFYPVEKKEYPRQITQKELARWGHALTTVNVGHALTEFVSFENIKNRFTVDMIVWFEFDCKKIALEKISQFSFESARTLRKSHPS